MSEYLEAHENKLKQVTLYQYSYSNKECKITTFKDCYEQELYSYTYYLVYSDGVKIECVDDWELDETNDYFTMWSLYNNQEKFFLSQIKDKIDNKLKKILNKAKKYKIEIDFLDNKIKEGVKR